MGREKPAHPRRTRFGHHEVEGTGIYIQPNYRSRLTDPGSGVHLWVATVAYRLSDDAARRGMTPGNQVFLDQENLAEFGVGCFKCEQVWSDRLSEIPCGGSMELLG